MSAAARSLAIVRARLQERLAEPVPELPIVGAAPLEELVGSAWGSEAVEEARLLRERQRRPIGRPRKTSEIVAAIVGERSPSEPTRSRRAEAPKSPALSARAAVRLPIAPAFVAGRGKRRETCRGYNACLDNFARGSLRDGHAHCPEGCSGYVELTRTDRVAGCSARAEGWS